MCQKNREVNIISIANYLWKTTSILPAPLYGRCGHPAGAARQSHLQTGSHAERCAELQNYKQRIYETTISIYLTIHPSIYLSIHLYIYPSLYPTVHLLFLSHTHLARMKKRGTNQEAVPPWGINKEDASFKPTFFL